MRIGRRDEAGTGQVVKGWQSHLPRPCRPRPLRSRDVPVGRARSGASAGLACRPCAYWSPAAPVSSGPTSSRPCGSTGTSPSATTSARTPAPTCATRRPSPGRWPVWTPCATRRRWSACGNGFADAAEYVSRNDLGTAVLLTAMAVRASGGWCSPGRWSCTGRAGTRAPGTGWCGRGRAPSPIWTRAASSRCARSAARTWPPDWSARTPRPTRATCTPRPSWPRSTWPPPGPGRPARRRCRCAYHNVYGPRTAPRHPVRRCRLLLPLRAGPR
ncbi:hypothetical protein STENM223S_02323 [Streptomyces tendae]